MSDETLACSTCGAFLFPTTIPAFRVSDTEQSIPVSVYACPSGHLCLVPSVQPIAAIGEVSYDG